MDSQQEATAWIGSDLRHQLRLFLRWILSGLIDGVSLLIWAGMQYGLALALTMIKLEGVDQIVFLALQVLFAITTLAPIFFYICQDIYTMWRRTARAMRAIDDENQPPQGGATA